MLMHPEKFGISDLSDAVLGNIAGVGRPAAKISHTPFYIPTLPSTNIEWSF